MGANNSRVGSSCNVFGIYYSGQEAECPECGKKFFVPPENIYKRKLGNHIRHYCSYTCYMKPTKKFETD